MPTLFVVVTPQSVAVRADRQNLTMTTTSHDTEVAAPATQLRLIVGGRELTSSPAERDWVLDERTRMVGRYGISQVRATLRQHRPVEASDSLAC